MTRNEEQELLELTRQNNELLRAILHLVQHDEANDFIHILLDLKMKNNADIENTWKLLTGNFNP